jgi:hypothetical protein
VARHAFLLVSFISVTFSLANLLLHYEALRGLSFLLRRIGLRARQKMLVVVGGALCAHLLEIVLFALAFWLFFELDVPSHGKAASFTGSLYISIESFASLGTSTGFPVGQLRLLAGMEALVGLILIGWTASFTYLTMQKFWDQHDADARSLNNDD